MPSKIEAKLIEAETDLAVLRCVLQFWRDPDTFSLSNAALAAVGGFSTPSGAPTSSSIGVQSLLPTGGENCLVHRFAERCFLECVRVQQQTSGHQNEPWRKRSTVLLKGIWAELEKLSLTDIVPDYDLSAGQQGVEEGKNGLDGPVAGSPMLSKGVSATATIDKDKDKDKDKGSDKDKDKDKNKGSDRDMQGQGKGPVFSLHTLMEVQSPLFTCPLSHTHTHTHTHTLSLNLAPSNPQFPLLSLTPLSPGRNDRNLRRRRHLPRPPTRHTHQDMDRGRCSFRLHRAR